MLAALIVDHGDIMTSVSDVLKGKITEIALIEKGIYSKALVIILGTYSNKTRNDKVGKG